MNKKVKISPAPNVENVPGVYFYKSNFDNVIQQNGYDIYYEKAISCPCRSDESGKAQLSDCRNCGGTGWTFLNKVQTKAVLHSMNLDTIYKDWTEEKLGTVSITVREVDKLSYMDRIEVIEGEVEYSQLLYPKNRNNKMTSYCTYNIKKILCIYLFAGSDKPLKLLIENIDYTFDKNKIILSDSYLYKENIQLSIRYIHSPTFNVIDIIRETMVNKTQEGPVSQLITNYRGRRSQYVLPTMTADLFDNSDYISDSGDCK